MIVRDTHIKQHADQATPRCLQDGSETHVAAGPAARAARRVHPLHRLRSADVAGDLRQAALRDLLLALADQQRGSLQ